MRQPTPDILGAIFGDQKHTMIDIADIRTDGGTQMRAGLHAETVEEYRQWLDELARKQNGLLEMPPVVVYHDGETYWLADGFHRLEAWKRHGGLPTAVHADLRSGTRRDAVLHAAAANASHGLRRTNADKRRSVETLLRDSEWSTWSDQEIGRRCAVDPKTVGNIRRELVATLEIPESAERRTADGRTINTAKIGADKREYVAIWQLQRAVLAWVEKEHPGAIGDQIDLVRAMPWAINGERWNAMTATLPTPWRVGDVKQACNNVADQLRQDLKRRSTVTPPAAVDIPIKMVTKTTSLPGVTATDDDGRGTATDGGEGLAIVAAGVPVPVRYVTDPALYESATKAYSADILRPEGRIRRPFWYDGALWTCLGGSSCGSHPETDKEDCLRIHPVGEDIAPGEHLRMFVDGAYGPNTPVYCGQSHYVLGAQWMVVQRGPIEALTAVAGVAAAGAAHTESEYTVADWIARDAKFADDTVADGEVVHPTATGRPMVEWTDADWEAAKHAEIRPIESFKADPSDPDSILTVHRMQWTTALPLPPTAPEPSPDVAIPARANIAVSDDAVGDIHNRQLARSQLRQALDRLGMAGSYLPMESEWYGAIHVIADDIRRIEQALRQ